MWPSQLYNSELYREVCKTGVRAVGKIPESMVYFTHEQFHVEVGQEEWEDPSLSPKGWDVELLG